MAARVESKVFMTLGSLRLLNCPKPQFDATLDQSEDHGRQEYVSLMAKRFS